MPIELTPQETEQAIHSLRKYGAEELDTELSELRAKLLLDFLLKEIGPLAYNCGVRDAEKFLRQRIEDLPATCFEPPFTHWTARKRK